MSYYSEPSTARKAFFLLWFQCYSSLDHIAFTVLQLPRREEGPGREPGQISLLFSLQISGSMALGVHLEVQWIGRSESNASYVLPWKLQQIKRAQEHYLIEQTLSYQTPLFNIVITITIAFSPAMSKSLYAVFVTTCTSGGDPLVYSPCSPCCPRNPFFIGPNR